MIDTIKTARTILPGRINKIHNMIDMYKNG